MGLWRRVVVSKHIVWAFVRSLQLTSKCQHYRVDIINSLATQWEVKQNETEMLLYLMVEALMHQNLSQINRYRYCKCIAVMTKTDQFTGFIEYVAQQTKGSLWTDYVAYSTLSLELLGAENDSVKMIYCYSTSCKQGIFVRSYKQNMGKKNASLKHWQLDVVVWLLGLDVINQNSY